VKQYYICNGGNCATGAEWETFYLAIWRTCLQVLY